MAISKIQKISKKELTRIEKVIGESFVTNELFHNWGTIEERRSSVLAYMKIYVDCVYRAGELYGNETLTGFVGIEDTRRPATAAKINMLFKNWLDEMKKCDWGAGQYLHQLLSENSLKRMVGKLLLYQCLWMGIS